MVNLSMSGQYFSLETVISEIYAKFPMGMMLSPNSTLDVRMDFSLPKRSLDYMVFHKRNDQCKNLKCDNNINDCGIYNNYKTYTPQ